MSDKQLLVQHVNELGKVIQKRLKPTQRIKFTCFDVSLNYIVFGATSGGLYIFHRNSNTFMKLIPTKYNAVSQICISPNEKTIVLGSSKGMVIVLENCFIEENIQCQVYTEHEGNQVTAIIWHGDEVYCGDDKGKVSVIVLSNLLTKAIFQIPSASLMQLDSAIVQIDSYSKFLLISTYTRTYICDTDKEQYKQIGKKLRDGFYGACFFTADVTETLPLSASPRKGLFKNMKDEHFSNLSSSDNAKIFCTRPGARIWEAKLDSSVTCTHQFRNYIQQESDTLIQVDDSVNCRLNIVTSTVSENSSLEQNFRKISLLTKKFLFTFNKEGIYVYNPENMSLISKSNYFKNIKDIKLCNNFIYIWTESTELYTVVLYSLEKLILKTLFNRQYYLTAELCAYFIDDVLPVIETSEKIHLVSILKEKLKESQCDLLLEKIAVVFEAIDQFSYKKASSQKLPIGITVVNTPFTVSENIEFSKYEKEQPIPETLQTLKEIGVNVTDRLTERTKNFKETLQVLETTVKKLALHDEDVEFETQKNNTAASNANIISEIDCDNEVHGKVQSLRNEELEINSLLKVFYQQYEATKINSSIQIPKFAEILSPDDLTGVCNMFHKFRNYMLEEKQVEEAVITSWCYRYYLKYLYKINFKNEIEILSNENELLLYLSSAFCSINFSADLLCSCKYPFPSARLKIPEFYEIGCSLLLKFRSCNTEMFEEIYKKVPYMWKCIIEHCNEEEDVSTILAVILQFGDENLLRQLMIKFTYDTWDNAVQLLIKLHKRMCLNCDNKFDKDCSIIGWTEFSSLMLQSIGGPSTISLLMRYASCIPSTQLKSEFYKSCIFATALDSYNDGLRSNGVNLSRSVQSNENSELQFDKLIAKFIQNKHMKKPLRYFNNTLQGDKTELHCNDCDLPMDIPVLSGNVTLKCNHMYHLLCFKHNNSTCKKCEK